MSEILEGLGGDHRERIASLRSDGHFFWIDVCAGDVSADELQEALGIPPHALRPLLDFERGGLASRRFHADGQHVVFPFNCYLEPARGEEDGVRRLAAIDINVLAHGDY